MSTPTPSNLAESHQPSLRHQWRQCLASPMISVGQVPASLVEARVSPVHCCELCPYDSRVFYSARELHQHVLRRHQPSILSKQPSSRCLGDKPKSKVASTAHALHNHPTQGVHPQQSIHNLNSRQHSSSSFTYGVPPVSVCGQTSFPMHPTSTIPRAAPAEIQLAQLPRQPTPRSTDQSKVHKSIPFQFKPKFRHTQTTSSSAPRRCPFPGCDGSGHAYVRNALFLLFVFVCIVACVYYYIPTRNAYCLTLGGPATTPVCTSMLYAPRAYQLFHLVVVFVLEPVANFGLLRVELAGFGRISHFVGVPYAHNVQLQPWITQSPVLTLTQWFRLVSMIGGTWHSNPDPCLFAWLPVEGASNEVFVMWRINVQCM
eukprot:m.93571 g.93571  ORF g.93571 m.93571 type:complete len:372 (-) comp13002_c0_seq4:863-1978(-)